ncbi:MAG TPA: protoporphyrinogen oxidase [Baekduia sp.]|nr:protoporphyrinogen oxidase [Baekduia sp.]
MSDTPVVAVLGGGISGLAAAHRLTQLPQAPRVVLIEAGDRLGGCIRSAEVAGVEIDTGPDSILARVPWGRDLLVQLRQEDELVSPARVGAHLWIRGALRPLPAGLMSGHARPAAIRRAGLLTLRGQLRAGLDFVLPGAPPAQDESIADAIGRRLGHEAVSAIADPLLGGVYAGAVENLSSRAAMPAVAQARAQGGSLLRALRAGAPPPSPDKPVFVSLRAGLAELPRLLEAELRAAGSQILLNHAAKALRPTQRGVEIEISGRESLGVDAVVLATPADAAADLLGAQAAVAAERLAQIKHANVAIVTMAFERASLPPLPASTGFLAGRAAGLSISACSLMSQKWPHIAPDGPFLLRCSLGRVDADPVGDDRALIARARADLRLTLGIEAAPIDTRIERYEHVLPQHDVGHLERFAQIEGGVTAVLPRVVVAGAWTRGIGIAACVRDGRRAAEAAIMTLDSSPLGADA